MKPIADFAEACLNVTEEEYTQNCHTVFFVHSHVEGNGLNPVGDTRKDTFSRIQFKGRAIDEKGATSVAYWVYEISLSEDRSETTIGSSSDCGIQVNDQSISRVHARLRFKDGVYYLGDNYSAMGTNVNSSPLMPEEFQQLQNGDRIELGMVNFMFMLPANFHRLVVALHSKTSD